MFEDDEDLLMVLGDPLEDGDLDDLENAATAVIDAIIASDFDTAFITASTCANPAMLAMFIAEMAYRE